MKPRGDWSIAQRLGLGFGLMLAVLAVLMLATRAWASRAERAKEELETRIEPRAEAATALESRLLHVAISLRAWLVNPSPEALQRHALRLDEARQALQTLASLPREHDGEVLFQELRPLVEVYLAEVGRVVQLTDRAELISKEQELAERRRAAFRPLEAFSLLQRTKRRAAVAELDDAQVAAARGSGFAVALASLLFAVVSLLTARSITRPAARLVEVAASLENGDWRPALVWAPGRSASVQRPTRDEMLKLAQAFGAAAAALQRREQRLQAEGQVASAAGSSLSKEAITRAALTAICEHVKAEVGTMYWMERPEGLLPIVAHSRSSAEVQVSSGELARRALEARQPVLIDETPARAFEVTLGGRPWAPRVAAAFPIAVHGEDVGVLMIASQGELDADDIAFLQRAGVQLGIGLQNVQAYEQVKKLMGEVAHKSEQIQAQNEELQAQNEEIHAQNEELQAQSEEIQAQNEQLRSTSDQLRTQGMELEQVDRRRSQFLAVLAHELRNPLAAISNSLYALSATGPDEAIRARALGVMGRQARVLARLVDDLLDVTRIEAGKIRLEQEKVDLVEVVQQCAEDYRRPAQDAELELVLELPPAPVVVDGDRIRLQQIVGNLLDNAVKYGGKKKAVQVRLAPGPDGTVELRVRDEGIGIDASVLAQLFRPFSQANTSPLHHQSGLGLGLALVKALAELHHGSVWGRSDGLGRGAEFFFRLPLAGATEQLQEKGAGARAPRPSPRRHRVLIVEDNDDVAQALRDSVELCGHEVKVALDAHEGISTARTFRPNVLLCDLELPSMDGYEVARAFRADEALKSVLLIAVTSYTSPSDQEKAARAGFDRHFGKPPDIARLQKLLSELGSPE